MFCKYCGKIIDDDSIYCCFCGRKVITHPLRERRVIFSSRYNKGEFNSQEELLESARRFCENYRANQKSYYYYREIINQHLKYKDITTLLKKDDFFELIYKTLISWNMNQRGAKLKPFIEIKKAVLNLREKIIALYRYRIEELKENELPEVLQKLEFIFINLRPMKSRRQIIGTSKLLHFLLPNLVMPIDGRFTMRFFYGYNKYRQEIKSEFRDFKDIFINFYKIIKKFKINKEKVDNQSWNASVPKIMDNAIIGKQKYKIF